MKPSENGPRRKATFAAIRNSIIAAIFVLVLYMMVVILTTPSLSPFDAVTIAARVNDTVISGLVVGMATQSFLVTYSRQVSCGTKRIGRAAGTSAVGSVLSSFLSFFTLVPVGCCGTWLYVMSFLPGVLGVGVSAYVVRYSQELSYFGLVVMGASIAYTYLSIEHSGLNRANLMNL